jgi:hypothetical protein
MSALISSIGTFRYTRNWCFIDCDPGIGEFYRSLYRLSVWKTNKLQRPEAKEHITVISKYDQPNVDKVHWGFKDGEEAEFWYNIEAEGCDVYVWFPVVCPKAQEIRDKLSCGTPHYPFHLTLGNKK